jgi:hypothetical protein
MAIVPDNECKMPTLMGPVSLNFGVAVAGAGAAEPEAAAGGAVPSAP